MQQVMVKLATVLAAVGVYVLSTYFPDVSESLKVLAGLVAGLAFPEMGKRS